MLARTRLSIAGSTSVPSFFRTITTAVSAQFIKLALSIFAVTSLLISFGTQAANDPYASHGTFSYSASNTNSAQKNTIKQDIVLDAGKTIVFGTDGITGALGSGDTYLRLYYGSTQVAYNDDISSSNLRSKVTYTVPAGKTGTYQMRAGCYSSRSCNGTVAYEAKYSSASYPSILPRVMMITWYDFNADHMAMYQQAGVDTVYRSLGAADWSFVESTKGSFNFSRLDNAMQLASNANLKAIPTISFDTPPQWFTNAYPDSILRFSDGTYYEWSKLSPAWLADAYAAKQRGESRPDYDAFENFLIKTVNELGKFNNIIGLEIPWVMFADRFYKGDWDDAVNNPQNVLLAGFDKYYKQRWTSSEPQPRTWAEYEQLSAAGQNYWQDWAEDANGQAAQVLLNILHNLAPTKLIVIRKHLWIRTNDPDWMVPQLGTLLQLNERQYAKFLTYVKGFSSSTGWKGIMLDNDAFFDGSKVENSKSTKQQLQTGSLLYLGEGQNNANYDQDTISNIKAVRPTTFSFIPYPGQHGEQIQTTTSQEIIRLMNQ